MLTGRRQALPSPGQVADDVRDALPPGVPADLAALLPVDGASAAEPDTQVLGGVARREGDSLVKVLATGCGVAGSASQGSGFVADDGLVVTNAHVVRGASDVTLEGIDGRHRAAVVVYDASADIAVLRTTGLPGQPLPMATSAVTNGTRALVLGYRTTDHFRPVPPSWCNAYPPARARRET